MLRAKIVGIFENYSVTGIEVRHNAIDEVIHSGRFHGKLVYENEYGSKYIVANCLVTGDPAELLQICRDAQSNVFSYIIYPIDRVEIV